MHKKMELNNIAFKEELKKMGKTQTEVAEEIGISRQSLSEMLLRKSVRTITAEKISKASRIPLEKFATPVFAKQYQRKRKKIIKPIEEMDNIEKNKKRKKQKKGNIEW